MGQRSGDLPARAATGSRRKRAEPLSSATTKSRRRSTTESGAGEPVGPKVLVVDDDADIRDWLRLSLSLRGWTVEEAVTGDEAVERLGAVQPDVVLLDHQMPGMTGIECAAALREASAELRIILASAYIDAGLTRRAREQNILPIEKTEHARLFDLFDLLAEQIQSSRAPVA
jgi:CheY-like chemotaxis protein